MSATHAARVLDTSTVALPPPTRAAGPFEGIRRGAVDVPLVVRDLTVHGCLIELQDIVIIGRRISLQIKVAGESWITLKAETLRIRNSPCLAAKFISVDAATAERLARGIQRAARTEHRTSPLR